MIASEAVATRCRHCTIIRHCWWFLLGGALFSFSNGNGNCALLSLSFRCHSAVVPSQFFAVAAEAERCAVSMHSECSEKHWQMLWRQQQLLQLLSAIWLLPLPLLKWMSNTRAVHVNACADGAYYCCCSLASFCGKSGVPPFASIFVLFWAEPHFGVSVSEWVSVNFSCFLFLFRSLWQLTFFYRCRGRDVVLVWINYFSKLQVWSFSEEQSLKLGFDLIWFNFLLFKVDACLW